MRGLLTVSFNWRNPMVRNTRLPLMAALAAGALLLGMLLGYPAAPGKLNPFPRAEAAPPGPAAPADQPTPDPLPSWNDGPARKAILQFVRDTTDKTSPKYVRPEDRIATFDNDGTLWVEQPIYTQVVFAFDRVAALAP